MANGNSVTYKHIAAMISIVALIITCGGIVSSKAGKSDLDQSEIRMEKRVMFVQNKLEDDIKSVKENIREIKMRQEKMNDKIDRSYEILLRMERGRSAPN